MVITIFFLTADVNRCETLEGRQILTMKKRKTNNQTLISNTISSTKISCNSQSKNKK